MQQPKENEIKELIKKLKSNKSFCEMLKKGRERLQKLFMQVIQNVWETAVMPN